MLRKSLLTIVCIGITGFRLFSQNMHYQHFGTNEGLPSSQVYDIIQDDWGYLWFATDHGLSRYDGYSFENYNIRDGLTDNTVFNFHKYRGIIWCSTYNRSLFSIQGEVPIFKPYPYNKKLLDIGAQTLVTTSFYFSPQGHLYMSFVNGLGFIHLDEKGNILSNTIRFKKHTISSFTSVLADQWGRDFFFSDYKDQKKGLNEWNIQRNNMHPNHKTDYIKGIYMLGEETAVFTGMRFIDILSGDQEAVRLACNDEPIGLGNYGDGHFWVGFRRGGLYIYDIKGKLVRSFLEGKSVTNCYRDHEEGLWISTLHDGVYYIKNTNIHSIAFPDKREKWIHQITTDGEEGIFTSTYNGDVYHVNNSDVHLIYESEDHKPAPLEQNKSTGKVSYVSDGRLFSTSEKKSIQLNTAALHLSFIGTDSTIILSYGTMFVVTPSNISRLKFKENVLDLVEFNHQRIVATLSGPMIWGKDRLSEINGAIFENMRIEDLELFGNKLALGTHGSGIIIIDSDSTLLRIGKKEGLKSDFVSQLYSENDSTLWVCTNAGISRIMLQNGQIHIKNISTADGLIANEVTDIDIVDNTVWVGTREGLCYFSRSYLNTLVKDGNNNFLRFKWIRINDGDKNKVEPGYKLEHNENRLEVEFQGISFRNGDELIYRYRLSGLEGNWNYTTQRKAVYSAIPPGQYQLEVQALGIDGSWNTTSVKVDLYIRPPYWKTWWFRLCVTLGIVALIYLFFRFRILSYNRDITRELLRQILKKIRGKEKYVIFREQGKDIRIPSSDIAYIKSSGNYLEIYTEKNRHMVRGKIGEFLEKVPDPLEYLRVHRSYIIRLDKVEQKGVKEVVVMGEKIAVGETYIKDLQNIQF